MRQFSSYGPVDIEEHFYAPRKDLLEKVYTQLTGSNPKKTGNYFTVWAPRQTGKTWIMQQILFRLKKVERFDTIKINLENLKYETDTVIILNTIAEAIGKELNKPKIEIQSQTQFQNIFSKDFLNKPLILILDEFDAMEEKAINTIVSAFRNIYINRMDEFDTPTENKSYLLHSVALIGVRSVLGIENTKGSPFNVQRSLHIPNLTLDEVRDMFEWYEKESGQSIAPEVIDQLFYETKGQPGLTCWFGELLTEGYEDYQIPKDRPLTTKDFDIVYAAATYALPNNNILNIISKAKEEPNKSMILDMFQTSDKLVFRFDDETTNSLFMNGVIDRDVENQIHYYIKFSCPFVQKRLFNYFSNDIFKNIGQVVNFYEDLDNIISSSDLNIPNLMNLYQTYLKKNHQWLFKSVPRRTDMRIYEAVFHFNLYSFLSSFLRSQGGHVVPEFPTGNGKIDLIITYKNKQYGIELKSFSSLRNLKPAIQQTAKYAEKLGLKEIFLVIFVEFFKKDLLESYSRPQTLPDSQTTVFTIFIETGN